MRALEAMMHANGGSSGVRLKDTRLPMDLPGANMAMLRVGADDILSLEAGPHSILQHLRESQGRLFP